MILERTERSGKDHPCDFPAEWEDFKRCAEQHLRRNGAIAPAADVEMNDCVVLRVVGGVEVFEEGCDGVVEV